MALGNPGRYRPRMGLVWDVQGAPFARRTRISLLLRGRYAQCMRDHPEIRIQAISILFAELFQRVPVDTGRLRSSIRMEQGGARPSLTIGPEPYNRQQLKATLEGRVYRRRVRRPRLTRFYALPANVRSHEPRYIEDAIDATTRQVIQLCRQIELAEQQLEAAAAAIGGARRGRRR